MARTKTKKFRGSMTHGRGKKAGRGAGLRGGRGMAGINKHRFTTRLKIEAATHKPYWGRVGFKRHRTIRTEHTVTNVGRLEEDFPGIKEIDLGAAGVTKLLGAGAIGSPVTVKVQTASASAVEKIEAAGGKVEMADGGAGASDQ